MENIYKTILLSLICLSNNLNAQPTISSFAPTSGPIGTIVNITGTGFDTIITNNIVFFGATLATVNTATATNLNVTVPIGATYQNISVTNLTNNLSAYSLQPFIVTFPCGDGINSSSFAPIVNSTTGTGPMCVSIGDMDGDGKPDLIASNIEVHTVSVLRNISTSGTISFAPKLDINTPAGPYSVSIGDLDNDGKLDFVITNITANKISVFMNTSIIGTISFAPRLDFSTSSQPISVAIGDLNGDGKSDLVVSGNNSDTLSIFKNTSIVGSISFATRVTYSTGVGSVPWGVAIGDLDGDGKPDLAVADYNLNLVSIFRNTNISSTISFAPKVDYATGGGPYGVVIGDLDGDNKPDLGVVNEGVNSVSTLRNLSVSGTISFAAKIDFPTGTTPLFIAINDLDGDGMLDLSTSDAAYFRVSALKNTSTIGTISFSTNVDFITGSNPRCVAIGDLDGDGMPDLATANYGSSFGTTVSELRRLPCSTTGITSDGELSLTASISPNPFIDQTLVSFSREIENASIKIIDLLGREIKTMNFSGRNFILEKGEMKNGIYFVQIRSEDKNIITKKIILQ